ncbi:hypothetical protein ACGFIE_06670 [Micromonospora sp. NPDC049275]|uniref:hypothetical protein n=1 Tax=Micromonospora sp. NPDC049275 TaxID=3364268 RepID=UPI00371BBA46
MKYVSRVPRPPLDLLIDDLYYLEGAPPYARLTLPPMPAALLIVNLGAPFRIRAGTDIEAAEYADGCVVTTLAAADRLISYKSDSARNPNLRAFPQQRSTHGHSGHVQLGVG